jgi:hypothetical protein
MTRSAKLEDAKRFHQLLTGTVNRLSQDVGVIVFQKRNGQHFVLACLYATIIQSTRECLNLMSEPTITLPTILRSILEAYADLRAILKDADHGQRILATFHAEKRRHLKGMIASSGNPYHQVITQQLDPHIELPKVEAEIKRLEELGHHPMFNRQRFEWAELENEYESLYWLLCLEGHNSVTALESRHVIKLSGGDYDLIAVKENSVEDVCRWCDALFRLLIDATVRLYGFLGIKRLAECERDLQNFNMLTTELFGPDI